MKVKHFQSMWFDSHVFKIYTIFFIKHGGYFYWKSSKMSHGDRYLDKTKFISLRYFKIGLKMSVFGEDLVQNFHNNHVNIVLLREKKYYLWILLHWTFLLIEVCMIGDIAVEIMRITFLSKNKHIFFKQSETLKLNGQAGQYKFV